MPPAKRKKAEAFVPAAPVYVAKADEGTADNEDEAVALVDDPTKELGEMVTAKKETELRLVEYVAGRIFLDKGSDEKWHLTDMRTGESRLLPPSFVSPILVYPPGKARAVVLAGDNSDSDVVIVDEFLRKCLYRCEDDAEAVVMVEKREASDSPVPLPGRPYHISINFDGGQREV